MTQCMNRLIELKQQWSQFSDLSINEKVERSKDIETLIQELEKKLLHEQIFEESKSEVNIGEEEIIADELERIFDLVESMKLNCGTLMTKENDIIEHMREETEQRCLAVEIGIEKEMKEIERQSKEKMEGIKLEVAEENKECMEMLSQEKKNIKGTKEIIIKKMKECEENQTKSLDELCARVNEEVSEIHAYIEERRITKQRKEEKLRRIVENLEPELARIIDKEEKLGKITYESLLKLMDDFHTEIKNNTPCF